MLRFGTAIVALVGATTLHAADVTDARRTECGVNYAALMLLMDKLSKEPDVPEADKKTLHSAALILAERTMSALKISKVDEIPAEVQGAIKDRTAFVEQDPDKNITAVIEMRKQCDQELGPLSN